MLKVHLDSYRVAPRQKASGLEISEDWRDQSAVVNDSYWLPFAEGLRNDPAINIMDWDSNAFGTRSGISYTVGHPVWQKGWGGKRKEKRKKLINSQFITRSNVTSKARKEWKTA